jgi:hypothetical protein
VQVTTALKLLVIADRHYAVELKSTCVKVILERSQEVVKQTGWREILEPYPRLLADMFEAMASSPPAKSRRVE